MKAIIFFLAAALTCTVSLAQNSSGPLNFLEIGKDYEIQFPEGTTFFEQGYLDKLEDAAGKVVEGPTPLFHVVKVSNGSWAYLEYPADPSDYAKWNTKRKEASPLMKAVIENQKQDENQRRIVHELAREVRLLANAVNPPPKRDLHLKHLQDTLDQQKRDLEQSTKTSNAILERQAEFNKEITRTIKTKKTWVNLDHAISITEALPQAEPIAGVKAFTLDFKWWVGDAK